MHKNNTTKKAFEVSVRFGNGYCHQSLCIIDPQGPVQADGHYQGLPNQVSRYAIVFGAHFDVCIPGDISQFLVGSVISVCGQRA